MKRPALTLVEMLVAMAITLVMMGAVVTLFGTVANSVSSNRAAMEMSERLRNCRNTLQKDLSHVTVTMLPPRRPEQDEGYFEYIEGPLNDQRDMANPIPDPLPPGYGLRGDTDDVLMFTARGDEPFTGNINGTAVQSHTAEIVYFCAIAPNTPTLVMADGTQLQLPTLYRRVLLVSPAVGNVASGQEVNDLSCRFNGTDYTPNNLGDTTKRENRFAHPTTGPDPYPFEVVQPIAPLANGRIGEDVILTNVLAFDVKAYDPLVKVKIGADNVTALLPSDVGYTDPANLDSVTGGYVDLYFDRYATPGAPWNTHFSGPGQNAKLQGVYDTWSMHYEAEAGTALNGLDDDGNGVVDDVAEQQAPPPYVFPLRGVQIKIRMYEPDSRQIREATIIQDFLPQ